MARSFDFDAARAERLAQAAPPTMTVGGVSYTLPVGMPAAVALDLTARDPESILTISEVVGLLRHIYPDDVVDGWIAGGFSSLDLYELWTETVYLVRGLERPDDEDGDGSGEARAPDSGRSSSSKDGPASKPTSPPTTEPTSTT